MRKSYIIALLIFLSSFSYAQITAVSIANKYENPILRTDSIILKRDNSILGKNGMPAGNFRICTPSRSCLSQKRPLCILKFGKWVERSTDSLFLNLLSPNDIVDIQVPKDGSLLEYGDAGKNGVIILTIKRSKALEYKRIFEKFKAERN